MVPQKRTPSQGHNCGGFQAIFQASIKKWRAPGKTQSDESCTRNFMRQSNCTACFLQAAVQCQCISWLAGITIYCFLSKTIQLINLHEINNIARMWQIFGVKTEAAMRTLCLFNDLTVNVETF